MLAVERGGVARLEEQWCSARDGYFAHLEQIGVSKEKQALSLYPILIGPHIAGVVAKHVENWHSLWLLDKWRGQGHGEAVLLHAIERGLTIAAHDDCMVTDYYYAHGYKLHEKHGKLAVLIPPTKREDLREAATLCLVNPATKRVLMGNRLGGVWCHYYCFPGGNIEKGEEPLAAALREFKEETRKTLLNCQPVTSSIRYAGWNDGERAYRIHNFVFFTFNEFEVSESDELECRWLPLNAKLKMGSATRAIRFEVQKLLSFK